VNITAFFTTQIAAYPVAVLGALMLYPFRSSSTQITGVHLNLDVQPNIPVMDIHESN